MAIKLYTVQETAEMLGLSASCIYKSAESGKIDSYKIGSALRFSDANIHDFLEKCKTAKPAKSIGQTDKT